MHMEERVFTGGHFPSPEEIRIWQRKRRLSRIGGFCFYAVLIAAVLAVYFFYSATGAAPRTLFGYGVFRVLTSSMQGEIPQGSFVIIKQVEANMLAVGDNITFLKEGNTTVTHKIIALYKHYGAEGQPAFQTQGVENSFPDEEIVLAANVIGKVVFHSATLGNAVNFMRDYAPFILVFAVLISGLISALYIFCKSPPQAGKAPRQKSRLKRGINANHNKTGG